MNIHAWSELSIEELLEKTKTLKFSNRQKLIAEKIIEQIQDRLSFLDRVGASYLSLNRPSFTLSGGEAQRIRLASQIAAGLVGVLYVLDEPSIGLHPQDHSHLLSIINEIRDRGNTVIIVEHDEESILCSDYVFDLGPGAGIHGGEIMARGTPKELMANPKSITGNYLSGRQKVFRPNKTRKIDMKNALVVEGAQANNLKNINVQIPLQTFTTITGVSGSGKSSLAIDTIYQYLANEINDNSFDLPKYKNIKGAEKIERLVNINQKPIGRTPRSNPATYTGLFSAIRELFAGLPDSKIRGFKLGHFSFNVKGGRCEACEGAGKIKVEMNFLSNVYVDCDTCQGKRYNRETMGIRYKSKNIADVLDMDVSEACVFFENHKSIHVKLQTLERVGLGYIKLGQSSTTLSGGEAQRIKLSKELSKRIQGGGFYILDEPTTGLHFADISKLIELLHELVDLGNSVFVIEHNLDVMAASDYLIELGPSGGPKGGNLINQGTPKDFCQNPKSPTAKYLKNLFL